MLKRNFLLTGIISLLFLFPIHAVEFSVENNGNSYDFDIGGYGGILGGQAIKGLGMRGEFDHRWLESAFLGLLLDATVNEKIQIILNGEFYQVFSYNAPETELGVENRMDLYWIANWFYLREARGKFTLGDPERFALAIRTILFIDRFLKNKKETDGVNHIELDHWVDFFTRDKHAAGIQCLPAGWAVKASKGPCKS